MDAVLRVAAMYALLWLVFRLSGQRTLSEMSSFDFILLLVISETTQQAMIDNDHSFTNAALLIVTFVGLNIILSLVKARSHSAEDWLDGVPIVLVEHGKLMEERMRKARVDQDDILAAAREKMGLERLDQIRYAVLERSGGISIIPEPGASA